MHSLKLLRNSSLFCTRTKQGLTSVSAKCASTSPLTSESQRKWEPKPWRICAAVSIERLPIITPELTGMPAKMNALLNRLENEQSLKSDHEMRHLEDIEIAEKKKAGETVPVEKLNLITAFDDEERWKIEANKFTPASRKTESESKNDIRSLERCLDRSLFLIVQNGKNWCLPRMSNENGESLKETAERAIQTFFGEQFKAQVMGNAPFSHYTFKYSKKHQEDQNLRGEKVFIYKAYFQEGMLDLNKEMYQDYQWLKREELLQKVDRTLQKPLSTLIYEDQ